MYIVYKLSYIVHIKNSSFLIGFGYEKRDVLDIEDLETYALKNAENHQTVKYELVKASNIPVLRRSANFFLGVRAKNRPVDFSKDDVKVVFLFGKPTHFKICKKSCFHPDLGN